MNSTQVEILTKGTEAWNAWRQQNPNETLDLAGAQLPVKAVGNLHLYGVNLRNAILTGAVLTGQDLSGAELRNANLRSAQLNGIRLAKADLRNADLGEAQFGKGLGPFEEDLSGDPSGAMSSLMREVGEEGGHGTVVERGESTGHFALPSPFRVAGIRLRSASLDYARLDGANLERANLKGASLRGASLCDANLNGADLEEADLRGVILAGAVLHGVNLSTLNLSYGNLTELPKEFTQVTGLRTLDLRHNQLRHLPAELAELRNLTTLDVRDNQLTSLPTQLRQMTQLECLFLHGNVRLALPDEVLGPARRDVSGNQAQPKSPQEILDAYFRIDGAKGEALGECKLIVVGRGGAGKTSLIKRLRGRPFDPNEAETHGITIQKLGFEGQLGNVTARVWDFGGQVVLHSMHEFFLTARTLYLLVLGERDDMLERDAVYWLQLIRSYAGDAPVIVALNKSAGRKRAFDRESLERSYGPILGWAATECSEPDTRRGGVDELRQRLTDAMDGSHMESVRRKFPRKWARIKEDLETLNESYLDYEAFMKQCEKHGEHDAKEQAALAGDLHDLGVALNYGRDPRLRDTTVLRPDWLANGIYAVLRANDTNEQLPPDLRGPLAPNGVITAESIAQIHRKAEALDMIKASDYPSALREFLLRLMELFHLSYPLSDDGREQLVPTLLPLEPPPGAEEPTADDRVRLRYEFQVVPAPLVPWLIARMFSLIPKRQHWRRGAILVYADARARVWTTQDERYVFLSAAGTVEDLEQLVTMIRGTLHELFTSYRGLVVTEQQWYDEAWVPRSLLEKLDLLESDVWSSGRKRLEPEAQKGPRQ